MPTIKKLTREHRDERKASGLTDSPTLEYRLARASTEEELFHIAGHLGITSPAELDVLHARWRLARSQSKLTNRTAGDLMNPHAIRDEAANLDEAARAKLAFARQTDGILARVYDPTPVQVVEERPDIDGGERLLSEVQKWKAKRRAERLQPCSADQPAYLRMRAHLLEKHRATTTNRSRGR